MKFSSIPSDVFDLVDYDPETGLFRHKARRARMAAGSVAGGTTGAGYIRIRVHGVPFQAHRLAWFWKTREPVDFEIDHINGDRSDNRLVNLRPCTHAQNQWNTPGRSDLGKGVRFDKRRNTFVTSIMAHGVRTYVGQFPTAAEARAAYIGAATILHGEFARAK